MARRLPSLMLAAAVAFALPAGAQQAPPLAADGGANLPPMPAAGDGAEANAPPPAAGPSQDQRDAAAKPRRRAAQENQPALIRADQLVHDRDLNTVTARGHVEVDQGDRVLLADTLSYNLKQDVIIATGNVSLTESTGEVTFANYIELTGDMKSATAKGIRVLMIDDSHIAANNGHRDAGDRSIFNKGVYTACKPCADGSAAPLWQIKADRITHNEVDHIIEYDDAWMEMDGFPVAYTPYLSHADPTVKRQSGLLPPTAISNDIVGNGLRMPYFWVIDPYQDLTVTPMLTSAGLSSRSSGSSTSNSSNGTYEQMLLTHRWRFADGAEKTTFSVSSMPQSEVENKATIGWHVDAYSRFDLDDTWRAGYDVQRASDRYYLESFGYHPPNPYLTTHPYLEGFGYRDYASVEAYSYQSLTQSTSTALTTQTYRSPLVFPLLTYSYSGTPNSDGAYWTADTHTAAISREQGTNDRRINTLTAWNLPYTTDDGQIYKISTSLRADAYNSDHVTSLSGKDVNMGRAIPTASVDWRYPFTSLGEHSSQTVTPIVVASASPYGGNSFRIPNEDSLDFELDDSNIFKADPGAGYDRVLTGPRVAYGGEYTVVNRGSGSADVLLAQSYQAHPEAVFPEGSGLDGHLSDIVGRTTLVPSSNFSLQYGFRMDKDKLSLRRNEVIDSLGPKALNLTTAYVKYAPTDLYPAREELDETLSTQITRYWSTQIYTNQKLGSGASPIQSGFRVIYEDECFYMSGEAGSRHTTVNTFVAGHYLLFSINFKTLGVIPVDIF